MKDANKIRYNSEATRINSLRRLQDLCERCYQGVLRRLSLVKADVEREFSRGLAGYEKLLKSAMNEAEALAWQTPYPHLFFPVLAEEKAAAVQRWAAHQREVREREHAAVAA